MGINFGQNLSDPDARARQAASSSATRSRPSTASAAAPPRRRGCPATSSSTSPTTRSAGSSPKRGPDKTLFRLQQPHGQRRRHLRRHREGRAARSPAPSRSPSRAPPPPGRAAAARARPRPAAAPPPPSPPPTDSAAPKPRVPARRDADGLERAHGGDGVGGPAELPGPPKWCMTRPTPGGSATGATSGSRARELFPQTAGARAAALEEHPRRPRRAQASDARSPPVDPSPSPRP